MPNLFTKNDLNVCDHIVFVHNCVMNYTKLTIKQHQKINRVMFVSLLIHSFSCQISKEMSFNLLITDSTCICLRNYKRMLPSSTLKIAPMTLLLDFV